MICSFVFLPRPNRKFNAFPSSIIGIKWESAVKDLMEHYAQREASYPLLKQLVLENLRKIKVDKAEEYNRVNRTRSRYVKLSIQLS